MKLTRHIFLATSLLFIIGSYPLLAQRLSKAEAEQVMWNYIEKYSPDNYLMMQKLEGRPSTVQLGRTRIKLPPESSPMLWIEEYTDEGIRRSLNTIVHETHHGFTSSYPYVMLEKSPEIRYKFRDDYSAFFITPEEIYLVKHTEVFSSHELARYTPKNLRTFRFGPYIYPKDTELGSQVNGIYGLMDEWNAYYHGTKMAYDLFDHYGELAKNNPQIYLEHIADLAGTYFAYYEFKYYILQYMIHARRRYPDIYGELLTNHELRKAYGAIDQKYNGLIKDFELRLDQLSEQLNKETDPKEAYLREGFYFIGRKGVGLFVDETNRLKKELQKETYVEMDKILKPLN